VNSGGYARKEVDAGRMLAKITQPLVANIQAHSGDITIVDTVFSGLELRVRRSGGKTWIFRYRMGAVRSSD
jgi:hypothetical protein